MNIYKATEKEISVIGELARPIWIEHYIPIIGEQQVAYMLNLLYNSDALLMQMETGQDFYIVEVENKAVGFAAFTCVSEEELFLNKFYILPSEQGRGLGRKVFAELLTFYSHIKEIRLQVNRTNFKSINFYFRLGFYIEQVADFDIGGGYFMNDFVMRKEI